MWIQALRVIPRIDQDAWRRLDLISRWLIAARDAVLWTLTTVALLLAHGTNNLLNDWTDHRKGVDRDNSFRTQYGPHPIESGLMTDRTLLKYAAMSGALALVIGAYLVAVRGPLALALLAAGAFFVLFYTYPLKYIGLGEIAVLIVWGPLMIGGTYFITTGVWDSTVALAGMPYALGATGVIFGKHIDKYAEDRVKRIRTLPVIIGERAARAIMAAILGLQYVFVAYLVAIGFFTPILLIVFLALPKLLPTLRVLRAQRPSAPPAGYPERVWPGWFVAYAFVHNRRWGSLLLLGLIGDVVARQFIK